MIGWGRACAVTDVLYDSDNVYLVGFVSTALLLLGLLVAWRSARLRLERAQDEKAKLEGEEKRLFAFLHTLGHALEEDVSERKFHREIVSGSSEVIGGDGAAMYLYSKDRQYLVPAYITEECPALVGVPVEVLGKDDMSALQSHLRLSKVPASEGLLGAALAAGEAIWVKDVKNHESFRDAFVRYEGNVEVMASPLQYGGRDLGVLAVASSHGRKPFTANGFELFRSIAEQSGFALGNAQLHREAHEKRKYESELRTAREVQSILLPAKEPEIHGYRVSGFNRPARLISGDYFDYIPLGDGSWAIAVADVSGKGVAAGLLMTMCRSVLRLVLQQQGVKDPAVALSALNRHIFPDIREDMFISMALYVVNPKNGEVAVACAGHDRAPRFIKNSGEIAWVKPAGLAIGIDDGDVFERIIRTETLTMESGDCLLLYTDGVTEAVNMKGDEFGREQMAEVFAASANMGAESVVKKLNMALDEFVGEQSQMDDITMVVVEKR